MRSVVLESPGQFVLENRRKPELENDHDVLLKTAYVGICGSDIHYFRQGNIGDQIVHYPFVIGHECTAVVEATAAGVTRVRAGDCVAVDPAISCGHCDQCQKGRIHTCRNQKFLGCPGQLEGCMSDYFVMPEDCCYKLPDEIGLDVASLVEPLSIGIYAVDAAQPEPSTHIAVLGAGPIGLSVIAACCEHGTYTIQVSDPVKERQRTAERIGADYACDPVQLDSGGPPGFDAVFECCGEQDALDQAVDILNPGGQLLIIGIPEPDRIGFSIHQMRRKEISIRNIRRQNACMQKAIDFISGKQTQVKLMKMQRFLPGQSHEAFSTAAEYKDGIIKVVIDFLA